MRTRPGQPQRRMVRSFRRRSAPGGCASTSVISTRPTAIAPILAQVRTSGLRSSVTAPLSCEPSLPEGMGHSGRRRERPKPCQLCGTPARVAPAPLSHGLALPLRPRLSQPRRHGRSRFGRVTVAVQTTSSWLGGTLYVARTCSQPSSIGVGERIDAAIKIVRAYFLTLARAALVVAIPSGIVLAVISVSVRSSEHNLVTTGTSGPTLNWVTCTPSWAASS